MPEPTTDIKGRKKIPTWGYIAIAGGVVILYLYYKKKKNEEEPPASAYTAQSFIPVTAENVAGVGAGGAGVSGGQFAGESNNALIQAQKENNEFLTNFLKSEGEQRRESEKEFHKEQKELIEKLGSGGAPGSGQIGTGAGSGGGGAGATGTTPVAPPPPVSAPTPTPHAAGCPTSACGSTFTKYNPRNGAPGPHSCYHESREKAKKAGYVIHGYCDGHEVESRP